MGLGLEFLNKAPARAAGRPPPTSAECHDASPTVSQALTCESLIRRAYGSSGFRAEKQTMTEAREMLGEKFGPIAPDIRAYVQMACKFKDITPSHIRTVTEISCLKED